MSKSLEALVEKLRVQEAVTRLFVSTDRRDWAAVKQCFAASVLFDMTSMAGGQPATMTPDQIAAAWETGLRPIEHLHHQVGNYLIDVDGQDATAACYGIALHHKTTASGRNTRAFVGSYDFSLRQGPDGEWIIRSFRFNLKFLEGNLELEKG